jgi:hypothetical protein
VIAWRARLSFSDAFASLLDVIVQSARHSPAWWLFGRNCRFYLWMAVRSSLVAAMIPEKR